jgi:RNA polymerase sigma-70 factor (ECF subfamily)
MLPDSQQVTTLLFDLRGGDPTARGRLMEIVYPELRHLALMYLRAERSSHTLQATALVNELYIRLFGSQPLDWQNRTHFFAVAAKTLRRILVDYARLKRAGKRQGEAVNIPLDFVEESLGQRVDDGVLLINDLLDALFAVEPRAAHVVELRFFGGLTEEEISQVIGVSTITVKRDWRFARAWLKNQLGESDSEG